MKEGQPSVIYLKDYQVPDFLIEKTSFFIDAGALGTYLDRSGLKK